MGFHLSSLTRWWRAVRPRMALIILFPFFVSAALTSLYGTWSHALGYCILVTVLGLHSLANLANDYGDSKRALVPPRENNAEGRLVQAGVLCDKEVRLAILVVVFVTLCAGLGALIRSKISLVNQISLGGLGLLTIWASIAYSMGRAPYGARGFGDLSVFLFFGLLSVLGTLYLQLHWLPWPTLLPATAVGLLSTSLMNLNNLRDFEIDGIENKQTFARQLGFRRAQLYQSVLMTIPVLLLLLFSWITSSLGGWLILPMCIALPRLLGKIAQGSQASALQVYRPLFFQCMHWIIGVYSLFILGCIFSFRPLGH